MTEQVASKLDLRRKLFSGIAAFVLPAIFSLAHITQARAQSSAGNPAQNIADTWQGTLHSGRDQRMVARISNPDSGGYNAVFYSIDQGGEVLPVNRITLKGATVTMSLAAIGATYVGKLSADGKSITGTWSQGSSPLPLTLTRATPETAWIVPELPSRRPPMDANASPGFEVATIKPGKSDSTEGKMFRIAGGRRFTTVNTTLNDLISYAYVLHAKQILSAPAWAETDKYDVDAELDGEGTPSSQQWKGMMQKLLAERFQLRFHRDTRVLPVYVLTVAKTGPKLTESQGTPSGLPGLLFRPPGTVNLLNATMAAFAELMQRSVLDRPVVDQTGLTGKYDFTLNWTPDNAQFGGMGAKIPPPTDNTNAPPSLFTAIQEQIGLKLEATKRPAEVLVIDHVERPSAN